MQLFTNKWQFWLMLVLLFPTYVVGQISIPDADYIDTTEYINKNLGEHLIAVFSPKRGNYPENVELHADFNDTLILNYKWLKLNEGTFIFDSLAFDGNTTSSSYVAAGASGSDEKNGCYKLEITGADIDTAFYVWVYISTFQITGINIKLSTCEVMELDTDLDIDDGFSYFDLIDFTPLQKPHILSSVNWETVPEGIELTEILDPSFKAPTEYLRFNLTVKDNFGQTVSDYIDIAEYELDDTENRIWLRATKADFEASRTGVLEGDSITGGEAPLKVQFVNKSENAIEYKWTFYNDFSWVKRGILDSVLHESIYETPIDSITYYYPAYYNRSNLEEYPRNLGQYDVKLEAKGPVYEINNEEYQCTDTLRKYNYINVDSTIVPMLANVFTPPNNPNRLFYFVEGVERIEGTDSEASYERIKHEIVRSVRKFSIKIYSRWGDKVHEFDGDVEDWNGWDGTTLGNITAKTGVYFYSALITGWDGKTYNQNGYVHLFRDDKF